jgi:predicted protein tyrosine phosphatase
MREDEMIDPKPEWHQSEVIHCPDPNCDGMLLQSIYYHEMKCSKCKKLWMDLTTWVDVDKWDKEHANDDKKKKIRIAVMPIEAYVGAYQRFEAPPIQFNKVIIIYNVYRSIDEFAHRRFSFSDVNDGEPGFITLKEIKLIRELAKDVEAFRFNVCVCCDAGLSRSPAVAAAIAHLAKEPLIEQSILYQYKFLNNDIYKSIIGGE